MPWASSALLGILRKTCRLLGEVICRLSPVGAQKEARLLLEVSLSLILDPRLGQMESWPLCPIKDSVGD